MKVYLTGMGAVTSLGNNVETMFENLVAGKSAIKHFPEWEKYNGLFCHLGAPVPDYDIKKIPRTIRRTMSKMSEMAALASMEAVAHADLKLGEGYTPRVALCLGSTTGSPETMETYFSKLIKNGGPQGQMGTNFFKVMNHSVAANVGAALGFQGPVLSPSSACATSAHAMILGWELLQSGLYDIVIAGGADELHYTSAAIFDIVFAASRGFNDKPEQAPRPFDQSRDGLVVAEGAAITVMETEDSAKKRGANQNIEFKGGAYLCNGTHMSQADTETMVKVMEMALERASTQKSEIEYVNAHATATLHGDPAEVEGIFQVFGDQVPVSSLKGHFGHSLAACGTLEAIASAKMMETQTLIATRNLEKIDPACSQVAHIKENTQKQVRNILSNNFAFGGVNTSLVLSWHGR